MLIYLFKEKREVKGYWLFLWLIYPNCLVSTYVIPSKPGFEFFLKDSNKVGLFLGPINIKLKKNKLKKR